MKAPNTIYRRMAASGALFALMTLSQSAYANIVGSDFQNFNPTYNGLDFVTVHSSQTLEPCILNTGVFYNQSYNSLPFYESVDFNENEFRNRSSYSDIIGGMDFNVGYGISENWDVGANIQSIVHQKVENINLISGSFAETGISEIRLNTKYRLFGNERGGVAFIGSMNFNLVENNVFLGEDAGPTTNIEVAMDRAIGLTNWAVNLGYRFRQSGAQIQDGVPPLTNAFIYSTALSYLFSGIDTKLIWELYGSYPTESASGVGYKARSNLETLIAMKYDATTSLSLLSGLGTEVIQGTATPDWRFFLGMNFAIDCCKNRAPEEVRPVPKFAPEPVEEYYQTHVWEDPVPEVAADTPNFYDPPPVPEETKPSQTDFVAVQTEPLPPPDETFSVETIHFETASHTSIYGSGVGYLKELSDYLKKRGYSRVIVVGHTDSVGTDEYNMGLSRRRASTVANHLINVNGLERDKVRIKYFGESRPIADNGNYQGRKKNRRVEFEVYH